MASWRATHAEENQREGETCYNNWKRRTLWNNSKRHSLWNEMENDTRHEIQSESDLRYKSNSKEVSQPGERLPKHEEG